MAQEATASPLSPLERLPAELLERILVPMLPADLGVLPDKREGPTPVPTFDSVLRLIGLQRVSRRLRDLVRSLLMSKAGAVLLADAVRHRIYVSLREQHCGCRVGYTEALRGRLLGLADACTLAGREAVCAELFKEATKIDAPKLRGRITAAAKDAREFPYVRALLRTHASDIDAANSPQYDDHLDRMSVAYAQHTVRTIINMVTLWADVARGAQCAGAHRAAGAQCVVLWAGTADPSIPPPLRHLCNDWRLHATPSATLPPPTNDYLSRVLGACGSISLRQKLRALREETRCACLDCAHGKKRHPY